MSMGRKSGGVRCGLYNSVRFLWSVVPRPYMGDGRRPPLAGEWHPLACPVDQYLYSMRHICICTVVRHVLSKAYIYESRWVYSGSINVYHCLSMSSVVIVCRGMQQAPLGPIGSKWV